jgi:hypothetical protein
MTNIFYKTLDGTAGSYGHGDYTGYLPRGKRPGKWLPKVEPELCESGYHGCDDVLDCFLHYGTDLYECEWRGATATVAGDDKRAVEQMRLLRKFPGWTEENLRLFAVDCARIAVNRYGGHEILHACLDVTVGVVFGYCDSAAWDAARAAAWDAALAAALDAAWAAAWAATRAAVRAAVGAAAWDAAWAATRAAAWDEQRSLLMRYLNGEQGPFVEAS